MAIDQDQPSTSSASPTGITNTLTPEAKEESLKVALNALVHGKRHLLVKDVPLAISSLGEACRLLTEAYGPFGAHNAEAHFYYGKALLEQSRLDLAVFEGPECPKTESGEDDSEEDESEEDESEDKENEAESTARPLTNTDSNTNENPETSDTHTNGVSTSNVQETDETEPVDVKVDKPDAKEMEVEENVESDKTGDNGSVEMEQGTSAATEEDLNIPSPSDSKAKDADSYNDQPSTSRGPQLPDTSEAEIEEELGNLQLAWEVLEVAKVAFHRKIDELKAETLETKNSKTENDNTETMKQLKELEKRLADTHLLLGEVATESEMYGEAVQEFQTGLLLLTKIEEPDSREIAQYYFQIGLAYAFGKSFGDAIASFQKSLEIIEQRIRNLSEKVKKEELAVKESKEETNEESCLSVLKTEIEELNALLPELQEKISDTVDAENESKKAKEEESKEQEIIMRNSPVKNPNPPVANDISHLVKKRKKVDDGPQAEPPSKRICNLFPQQEDVSSSTLATNGDKNVSVE